MNALTPTIPAVSINDAVDPRLAFLARAAARHALVEVGEMTVTEAFDGLVVSLQCFCSRESVARMERHCRRLKRSRQ
jgi:hypothetical protein